MGKLDELRRTMGANVAESASRRDLASAPSVPTLASLSTARMTGVARSKGALDIPIDRIEPDPDQPREDFDPTALERLAASLKARGQLQPVRVRWDEGRGAYVLVCGERRWRAARMAGMSTLSCVVSDEPIASGDLLALQLIENCVREDLLPLEQAKAYRTLMDRMGWSGNRLSQELGINQSSVVHALALLDLPKSVQAKVEQGELSPSTAYEISKAEDPETICSVADEVVASRLTRAEAVERVRQATGAMGPRWNSKSKGATAKGKAPSKPKPLRPRSFRLPSGGKATLEPPRKAIDPSVMLAMAEELVILLRAELDGRAQEAA